MVSGLVSLRHRSSRARRGERSSPTSPSARVPGPLVPGTNCPGSRRTSVVEHADHHTACPWLIEQLRRGSRRCPRRRRTCTRITAHQEIPTRPTHPWTVVHKNTVFAHVTFQYASESGPAPVSVTASTGVKAIGPPRADGRPVPISSSAPCTLFETYDTYYHAKRSIDRPDRAPRGTFDPTRFARPASRPRTPPGYRSCPGSSTTTR